MCVLQTWNGLNGEDCGSEQTPFDQLWGWFPADLELPSDYFRLLRPPENLWLTDRVAAYHSDNSSFHMSAIPLSRLLKPWWENVICFWNNRGGLIFTSPSVETTRCWTESDLVSVRVLLIWMLFSYHLLCRASRSQTKFTVRRMKDAFLHGT